MTNGLRAVVEPAGTQVTALVVGFMDTPLTAGYDVHTSDPWA